jgi:hypothetical protein
MDELGGLNALPSAAAVYGSLEARRPLPAEIVAKHNHRCKKAMPAVRADSQFTAQPLPAAMVACLPCAPQAQHRAPRSSSIGTLSGATETDVGSVSRPRGRATAFRGVWSRPSDVHAAKAT